MSEEKPTFKVTDRRLFNPDGTPRDIPREEEPEPAPEPQQPAPRASEAPAAEAARPAPATPAEAASPRAQGREPEPEPQQPAPRAPEPPAAEAARPAPATPADAASPRASEPEAEPEAQGEAPGDEGFLMLVEFLASFAADALGMVNHPGGGGVNLQLAKQCIDMLGTLQRKTRGNLAGEEQQFLDMILSQLRMQYVSLTSAPRPPQGGGGGRGFTGGDITGGG